MRWIRTHAGSKCHAVLRAATTTLCGIHFDHVGGIVTPGADDRCNNCDAEWRKRGRASGPKRGRRKVGGYKAPFSIKDWE